MKVFEIIIESCVKCFFYNQEDRYCEHGYNTNVGKKIDNDNDHPAWCPLPDKRGKEI